MPVAVSSTPAAVAAATPCGPRISTAAAAPTLNPNGSWPSETTAMSTATASKTDASTPTAFSISQLRAICAKTAISTKATSRALPRCERSTDRPLASQRAFAAAMPLNASPTEPTATTHRIGVHQGSPSGPTSVNDVSAASEASTKRIGSSAAIRAGTWGVCSGAVRRNAVMRAAVPSWLFRSWPTQPMLDAR